MTLLQALRLMRQPEPLDPEDPLLIEATGVVNEEVQRLSRSIFRSGDAQDAAQRVMLKLFREATLHRRDGELESETQEGAIGFLAKMLFFLRIDDWRHAKRRRAKSLTGDDGGDIDVDDQPGDPDFERELRAAVDQFENELPHKIAAGMSTKAATTFLEVLGQLRALRDERVTMDELVGQELGDESVVRGSDPWKTARNRLYRRMKRCRDTIAEEIVACCDSGGIDKDRAALLFLFLDGLQFRQTDGQQARRSVSDICGEDVS